MNKTQPDLEKHSLNLAWPDQPTQPTLTIPRDDIITQNPLTVHPLIMPLTIGEPRGPRNHHGYMEVSTMIPTVIATLKSKDFNICSLEIEFCKISALHSTLKLQDCRITTLKFQEMSTLKSPKSFPQSDCGLRGGSTSAASLSD